jgi:hypothetical protein
MACKEQCWKLCALHHGSSFVLFLLLRWKHPQTVIPSDSEDKEPTFTIVTKMKTYQKGRMGKDPDRPVAYTTMYIITLTHTRTVNIKSDFIKTV